MSKPNLIIAGAGAAGLMAARLLSSQFQVTVIEANPQAGGRIKSFSKGGRVIEGGAEFVHGRLPVTLGLLKEAEIDYTPIAGRMYRKEANVWVEQKEMVEGWGNLLKRIKALKEDTTLNGFLKEYYSDDKYADLRRHTREYAEGFDLADPDKVSVRTLAEEWSKEEEENYRIPSGYGALIQFLEKECLKNGCVVITGEAILQVDWAERDIVVYTSKEKKYKAEKLIVTAPVGVLRELAGKASINFTPPIDEYIGALRSIGFGSVIKIVMQFKTPCWNPDTCFLFSDEMIPTWWPQSPSQPDILIGWAGGPQADRLSNTSDEQLLEMAYITLSRLFDKTPQAIRDLVADAFVFNWTTEEGAKGAYSYAYPATEQARKLLATPLADSLFFAGEGLYTGESPGTVEAALVSGRDVANKILGN